VQQASQISVAARPAPPSEVPRLRAGTKAIYEGALRPSDWLEVCLARIKRFEPALHAFQFIDKTALREHAARLDKMDWATQKPFPSLSGAPIAVKDIFNTSTMPTGMGSEIRRDYKPGNNARVIDWMELLGAYTLGKTKTAEFAVHWHPDTRNPWNDSRVPGTSSTGSAVAVACGMAPAALGTQSAGSISRPSSYNGVIGFKPSFGLIPRTGVLKTCDTLDSIGWMTRTVDDARLLLDALRIRGYNYPHVVRGFCAAQQQRQGRTKWRIGFGADPGTATAEGYARAALREFVLQTGNRPDIELVEIDLAEPLKAGHDVHRVIYHKALSYYFTREMAHIDLISGSFKALVDEGRQFSTEDYVTALRRQEDLRATYEKTIDHIDVFVSLAAAGEAPGWDQEEKRDSSLIWTLCGAPAIALPLFKGPNELPYSAQLVAKRYHDYQLLDFAESLFPGETQLAC
jgi:Asp-tRNA(Asn)/Glu-tRNA(Gln) amidotransferase A subunit family amidase